MALDQETNHNYNENTRAVNKAYVDVSRGSVSNELCFRLVIFILTNPPSYTVKFFPQFYSNILMR